MTMEITVSVEGKVHAANRPNPESNFVVVDIPCPHCKSAPLEVRGRGKPERGHDFYKNTDTITLCCGEAVDWIRVKLDTLFGLEEDERVLRGPWRVY
jgi:hypothetical protein